MDTLPQLTAPICLTFLEAKAGHFIRNGSRFSFDRSYFEDMPWRNKDCNPAIKIVSADSKRELFSPQTGLFDLIEGEWPDAALTIDLLTPFFKGRLDMLSLSERSLLDATLRHWGMEGGFSQSRLAERLGANRGRVGVGPQSCIAQYFSNLVAWGVFAECGRQGSEKLFKVKSPVFAAWHTMRCELADQETCAALLDRYSKVNGVKPQLVKPAARCRLTFKMPLQRQAL